MTLAYIVLGTLAAGLGSVLLAALIARALLARYTQHLLSLAAGALLATAFMHLLPEAFESGADIHGLFLTLLLGVLMFFLLDKAELWHHGHEHHHPPAQEEAHGHDHGHAHEHARGVGLHRLVEVVADIGEGLDLGQACAGLLLRQAPEGIGRGERRAGAIRRGSAPDHRMESRTATAGGRECRSAERRCPADRAASPLPALRSPR